MYLSTILNNEFFHHYQPIFDIQEWKIIGYEGLFRLENVKNPETTFNWAKKAKKLYELDSNSIYKALLTFKNAGYISRKEMLFLNVFPSTVTNPLFLTLIHQLINEEKVSSQQIIFEINENEVMDFENVKKEVHNLKNLGFRIAIDDVGKGFSSVKSIIELNPDFIKLDKYYLEDLSISEQKQDVVNSLLHYCQKFNSSLIVEGVEDKVCLALLKGMGIQYAQGYFLGMPTELP
ncbi:EAL domain-containing protein [Bacillus sp. EB600]|uniref:EAL domain-containing protein n=1 Tax=Bacillus sp. EB600 TaxID=2806345 RepID=UPI00210E27F4|nr:EAL domain-containing protein [Bacillus sp. EB600]MCQ6278574.1 EAL domain-containing protein [Bacillus sp. EB600]